MGIWYLFADYPVGESSNIHNIFKLEELKHTPIKIFKNNVAHSNGQAGLALFKRLGPIHNILGCSTYAPNFNPQSGRAGPPYAPVVFDGFIGEAFHMCQCHKGFEFNLFIFLF